MGNKSDQSFETTIQFGVQKQFLGFYTLLPQDYAESFTQTLIPNLGVVFADCKDTTEEDDSGTDGDQTGEEEEKEDDTEDKEDQSDD